jgi:hypothetical protein
MASNTTKSKLTLFYISKRAKTFVCCYYIIRKEKQKNKEKKRTERVQQLNKQNNPSANRTLTTSTKKTIPLPIGHRSTNGTLTQGSCMPTDGNEDTCNAANRRSQNFQSCLQSGRRFLSLFFLRISSEIGNSRAGGYFA